MLIDYFCQYIKYLLFFGSIFMASNYAFQYYYIGSYTTLRVASVTIVTVVLNVIFNWILITLFASTLLFKF